MRTYRVGVCDRDLDYVMAFADYVNALRDKVLSIVVFTGIDAIIDYLSVQDLDLIITDDISQCEETGNGYELQDIRAIQFSEYRDSSDGWHSEAGDSTYIFKYQNIDIICRQILDVLTEGRQDVRKLDSLIAVYSPLGRCGKTKLARALAADDGVRGGLYIGLEEYAESFDARSSNIFYMIKSKSPELEEVITQQLVEKNGIHELIINSSFLDTCDVSFDDIETLKSCLLKSGRFTTLVFDIGQASLSELRILSIFDEIYMPVLRDEISVRKLEVFLRLLKELGLRSVISRLIRIDVPDADINSEEMIRAIWRAKGE